ncbi:LEA type 2 family protein [Luteimonas sp. BDR2-5]|uniref:NDR1/HIN1-like protein n=1 Tax=Proluteimonas luteida TaxID=2878685 RepID=UPI001E38F6B0|nr:LEA type 2 family protein [Luteimonas sp. BDR2-5]MCD9029396.1 LEA type 2 family protein [Luteimonas sp. BDR2-5]
MKSWKLLTTLGLAFLLAACATTPRRVSEPAASVQQLTVGADGSWSVDLRLQNYSSIPMRFESVQLNFAVGGDAAGTLSQAVDLTIGPESADIVSIALAPEAQARLRIADTLAGNRAIGYRIDGTIRAAPSDRGNARDYTVRRESSLNPVPGLPGVMR